LEKFLDLTRTTLDQAEWRSRLHSAQYDSSTGHSEPILFYLNRNKLNIVKGHLTNAYKPTQYWLERGKTYRDRFRYNRNSKLQEKMLLDYLKSIIPPFKSVLELGCGFGRITKLILSNFPDIQVYTAVDLSPHQIQNAREYLISGTSNNVISDGISLEFIVSDIKSLQTNKKYDLVISVEVLLHVLPSEITDIMSKLVSLSYHHIINLDYYQEKPDFLAPHNFLHQYENIYNELPSISGVKRVIIEKKGIFSNVNTKQSIFHATTRNRS
jgi:2-polyprenyl-3-methyl-5-hydroxy-6-metoxy-1,4-benzoquinol methylase